MIYKIVNAPLLYLVGMLMFVVIMTSCDKDDDDVSSDKVELLNFGPTGASPGDTLRFFGDNLQKVTAIQFTGNAAATVEQKDFKTQTSELILLLATCSSRKRLCNIENARR